MKLPDLVPWNAEPASRSAAAFTGRALTATVAAVPLEELPDLVSLVWRGMDRDPSRKGLHGVGTWVEEVARHDVAEPSSQELQTQGTVSHSCMARHQRPSSAPCNRTVRL